MNNERVFYWCKQCTIFPMISDWEKIGEYTDKDTNEKNNIFWIRDIIGRMPVKECLSLTHKQVLDFNSEMIKLDNEYEDRIDKFSEELEKEYEPKIKELLKIVEKK